MVKYNADRRTCSFHLIHYVQRIRKYINEFERLYRRILDNVRTGSSSTCVLIQQGSSYNLQADRALTWISKTLFLGISVVFLGVSREMRGECLQCEHDLHCLNSLEIHDYLITFHIMHRDSLPPVHKLVLVPVFVTGVKVVLLCYHMQTSGHRFHICHSWQLTHRLQHCSYLCVSPCCVFICQLGGRDMKARV
jgi:hypothetical protein